MKAKSKTKEKKAKPSYNLKDINPKSDPKGGAAIVNSRGGGGAGAGKVP
jgi:hypothetical protein